MPNDDQAALIVFGQRALVFPEEVVAELLRRGLLEVVDLHSLRVEPAHDMPDRAVLASRVEPLKDEQDPEPVLRGEPVVVVGEQRDALGQPGFRARLAMQPARIPGVEVLAQVDGAAGSDQERLDEIVGEAQLSLDRLTLAQRIPCNGARRYPRAMARLGDYAFGRLTVDGAQHTRDLIVLPDRVLSDWRRRDVIRGNYSARAIEFDTAPLMREAQGKKPSRRRRSPLSPPTSRRRTASSR